MNTSETNIALTSSARPTNLKSKKLLPIEGRLPTQQNPEENKIGKRIKPERRIKKGYEIANFPKAYEFLKSQSYLKKTHVNGEEDYEQFSICDDNENLKQYGLGIYLYLEFMKRLLVVLLLMSLMSVFAMVINYNGNGLSSYKNSYTIYLAKFTLGHLSNASQRDYLIVTITDLISVVLLFGFYFHWRSFHHSKVQEMEKDHNILNPVLYALSITGYNPKISQLEEHLKDYFQKTWKGCYEVEVVYDYRRNFHLFVEYDEIIQKIEKERQVIAQTGKSEEDLNDYQNELLQKQDQILTLSQSFDPIYAIIHFKTLKSKYSFVNFCKRYGLLNNISSKLRRCFCCLPHPAENSLFMGQELYIQSGSISRPEEINWNNEDISTCSKGIRWIISILLLIISVFITSSLIGVCTLYVASTTSCSSLGVTSMTLTTAINTGGQTLFCYCSQYYSFTSTNEASLESACSNISQTIIRTNLIQVAASVVSSITNLILIIAINLIATYILRPSTKSKQYSFVFIAVLVCTYLNSTFLPLLLNGNIFAFQPVNYLKFLSFINTATVSIYSDFTSDWYATISPYYVNFFFIMALMPTIDLLMFWIKYSFMIWRVKRACQNNQEQSSNPTIQKQANQKISNLMIDLPYEQAYTCFSLFFCMMYSSLIPMLIPIYTVATYFNYIVKKLIIIKFSVRVPANQNLSSKTLNLLPFILLIHACFGVWSHTTPGIFESSSYIIKYQSTVLTGQFSRIFNDILMLGSLAIIVVWIIFDYTIVALLSFFADCCCKQELQLPVQFAAVQNTNFQDRLRKTNILGSYKISKHPVYGHAVLAYRELLHKKKVAEQQQRQRLESIPNM